MKSKLEMFKETLRYGIERAGQDYHWSYEQKEIIWNLYINDILRGVKALSEEDRVHIATNRFMKHYSEGSLEGFFDVEPPQNNNMVI